jgi:hypothetical protein
MSAILRKVKSIPFLMKRKQATENLETFIQKSEPPSSDRDEDLDFLKRLQLAEQLADYLIALHERHDGPHRRGKVWYWGNDVDQEFPMTY